MTPPSDNQPSACGHTVDLGTCTLPEGHEFGHHDETQGPYAQWHDRSDDHGPGAYASIHPGDAVWRHERGECVNVGARLDETWCLWCLRGEREQLREALTEAVNYCTGRIGQIGASQVYTPQINVKAAERWRVALSRTTTEPSNA